MVAGQTNDDEKSVPPQKERRVATPTETGMAVDAKRPIFKREKQAINHFKRTSDEIMVIIISFFDLY